MDGLIHKSDEVGRTGNEVGDGRPGYGMDALVAKLLMIDVFGLVQAIGKQEDGGTMRKCGLLERELAVGNDADNQIGIALQFADCVAHNQWGIVASVAIAQAPRLEVEHSDEQGDKHAGVVVFDKSIVNGTNDGIGLRDVSRNVAEERSGDSHDQRGRYALARYVANAEEELIVANEEVEEVASDGLCRCQHAIDIYIGTLRKGLRQHGHLYVVGNIQLAFDGGFLGCGSLQLVDILCERVLHLFEGVAQQPYLVVALDFGQRSVEFSLCHLFSGLCQRLEGFDGTTDAKETGEEDHYQGYDDEEEQEC